MRTNLVLLIIISAVISGCASRNVKPGADKVVTIQFWNGFTGPDGTTMEKIVRRFNKEHPNINVRMQIIPWGTYYDKVTLGLAYGGAPDVFILHAHRYPQYANSQVLSCLDDLISEPDFDAGDFMPRPWSICSWKGRRYAVPLDCHPIGLYYNTELFKKAGIVDSAGNAKPPENLKEFLEDSKKLTVDKDKDGRPDQWGYVFTWFRTNFVTYLGQFEGEILDPETHKAKLDSPNARAALTLMTDFIYKYRICPQPEGQDSWIGFQTGKVAMALEGIYMLSSLEKQKGLKFAAAPCPVFGRRKAAWADSHLMVMPDNLTDEKRRAAWVFMKYLSDNSLEWSKGGQVPVRKSILATPEFKSLTVQYQFSRQLPYVTYLPASISLDQVLPFFDAAVEASLCGIKSPEESLNEAARRINGVLERE